jgi:hypothetical protein
VEREENDKIFSRKIRAGKRTYFFDVKSTKNNDYFIAITESRRNQRDGEFYYEKSKLFVYKEDFDKVIEAMQETVNFVKSELMPDVDFNQFKIQDEQRSEGSDFSDSSLKWD